MTLRYHLRLGLLVAMIVWLTPAPAPAYAAALVVNSANDSNDGVCNASHCSLREAIMAANANAGPDTISFSIPGAGPHRIRLASTLPMIDGGSTTIDGTSQPGYAGTPLIVIEPCSGPGPGGTACTPPCIALNMEASHFVVRGLSIVGFDICPLPLSGAILVGFGTGGLIERNYLGLEPSGLVNRNEIGAYLASAGQTVRDNVISGNHWGIYATTPNQVIQGNLVGTGPAGNSAAGNDIGIHVDVLANDVLIGGSAAGEGNVISGNDGGLLIYSDNVQVLGNKVGTDLTGTSAISNEHGGIILYGEDCQIGAPGAGNLISGNGWVGIQMEFSGHHIQGNQIGSDASGSAAIPNGYDGILLSARDVVIEDNLILANGRAGIALDGGGAWDNLIRNNTIRGNGGDGVLLNIIDINESGNGITLDDIHNVTISQNSIQGNGGLGIRLNMDSNEAISTPLLDSATRTQITGNACEGCLVELFFADEDPSGAGEGRTYLTSVAADPMGTFTAAVSGVSFCDWVTVTATDASGNTSEFSQNRRVAPCFAVYQWALFAPIALTVLLGVLGGGLLGRRLHLSRLLTLTGGGLAGGALGAGLAALAWALPMVVIQVPYSHVPLTRPTPTLSDVSGHAVRTLEALMTQIMSTALAATPSPSSTAALTATATPTPTVTLTPQPAMGRLLEDAFCRSGPGTVYGIVTGYSQGTSGLLDGRNAESSWYRFQQYRCWVFDGALERLGDVSGLPVLPPPSTPTPTPVLGCWVSSMTSAGQACTVPCPPNATPGVPCTP